MKGKDTSFEDAMKVFKLDTSAPAREYIEYIDIDKIDEDARNFYELSGLEELAANIELLGLQQPFGCGQAPRIPAGWSSSRATGGGRRWLLLWKRGGRSSVRWRASGRRRRAPPPSRSCG